MKSISRNFRQKTVRVRFGDFICDSGIQNEDFSWNHQLHYQSMIKIFFSLFDEIFYPNKFTNIPLHHNVEIPTIYFHTFLAKISCIVKKLLNSWFDEIFFSESKFFLFSTLCTVCCFWRTFPCVINLLEKYFVKTIRSVNLNQVR